MAAVDVIPMDTSAIFTIPELPLTPTLAIDIPKVDQKENERGGDNSEGHSASGDSDDSSAVSQAANYSSDEEAYDCSAYPIVQRVPKHRQAASPSLPTSPPFTYNAL